MKRSFITYTATTALSAILLAITVLAQSQASKVGQENTFTGVVSDNMCGAQHMLKDKTAAECTRLCVKQGQKYALVVGQKVYTLEGHEAELYKLAGVSDHMQKCQGMMQHMQGMSGMMSGKKEQKKEQTTPPKQ